jgi:PEP-CTERM motif
LNSLGDTVAVLASSLVLNQDRTISSYGDSYTLTGSGSSYHLFQLYENPTTGTADLYVDGVLSLSDYSGTGINALNYGLVFGAVNGGDVNFSLVSVVAGNAIPEPSTLSLLGTAAVIGLVVAARRALTATACRRSRAQH